jgi:hypothetical protein
MNEALLAGATGFEYLLAETGETFYWSKERALQLGEIINLGYGDQVALTLASNDRTRELSALLRRHEAGDIDQATLAEQVVGGNFHNQVDDLVKFLRSTGFITNIDGQTRPLADVTLYRGTYGFHPNGIAWADSLDAAKAFASWRRRELGKRWWWQGRGSAPEAEEYVFTALVTGDAILAMVRWDRFTEFVVDPTKLGKPTLVVADWSRKEG